MCKVFEVDHPEAPAKAVAMGNAMQLTNILRDVSEDWARGRVYLPQDEMRDGGVTEADLSQGKSTPALRVFICKQVARARELYQQGAQGLKLIPDDGSRLTACAMASIYGGILGAIEKKDYDVFSGRAKLNIWQKLVRVPGIYKLRRNTRDPRRDVLQGLAGWPS
jgi:phytoene synthase